ncbi:MAG: hypothetical protein HRU12_15570, partial [Phaeodactylibacter sp.]|nr:hypothetical protein [Phaeodactylibacter sp.]
YERLRAALPDLAGADNKTFNVRMGTATSRKMKSLVSDFWPDGDEPTPSKLRPLYAEIAFKLYPNLRFDMSKAGFFAAILGHDHNDVTTSLSYMDYYLDDKRTAKKALDHTQKDAQNRIRSWDETEVKTGKKK